jgi:hypothetical protein
VRNCFRGLIGGSIAVVASVAMAGSSFAAIGFSSVWTDTSLVRPAFSASTNIFGDARPELVVSDYGNYQLVDGVPILVPGAMYIYSNGATDGSLGDLEDWDRVTVFDETADITFPSQPVLTDVDGDGDVDILHGGGFFWDSDAGIDRGTITWWENQADGQDWVRHSVVEDSPWAYHNMQFADLDDDGIKDIVTVGEQGMTKPVITDDLTQVQFYKGLGGGAFASSVSLAERGGSSPVVRDVDGDGDLDVVSAQYFHVTPIEAWMQNPASGDASFVWFENTSDGVDDLAASDFVQHEISRGQGPSYGIYPVANLYGDGILRYIGVNHTNTTKGGGGAPFDMQVDPNAFVLTPGVDPTAPWDVVELADTYEDGAKWVGEPRAGQAAPGKVVSGDFDGDGDIDFVISGDGDFRAMLVEQKAPGVFHQRVLPGSQGYGQAGVTTNDFNADGQPEIVLSSFENKTLGLFTLPIIGEATISEITNGTTPVPATHGQYVRAGDLITISSGTNDDWEPSANWRATICTDAAGTECAPPSAEASLWADSPAPYVADAGATTAADGTIAPTQLRLASAADYTGRVYVKVYQGQASSVLGIDLVTAARTIATTATSVAEGATVPFTGSNFYPGETVTVTSNVVGAASASVVASATGAITGSVVANKPGTVKLVASAIGATLESGAFTVTAKPVVTPPVVKPPVKDTVAPVAKLSKPAKKAAKKATSWKRIKGTVKDSGTAASGPKAVSATLVAKTAKGQWKYFNGKAWKNAKSKKQALKKAKVVRDSTVATGKWSIKVKAPAKGTLIVRYWAVDKAGNTAKPKTVTQKITR